MRILAVLLATSFFGCAIDDPDESEEVSDVQKPPKDGHFAGGFKSPSIVRVGDTYHAYFAAQSITFNGNNHDYHVPYATQRNGSWSKPSEALPHLGAKADENGPVWAPGVVQTASGKWMLYYTAQLAGHGQKKCIWRARAASPEGPFVDNNDGPLVCPDGSLWALDAYPYVDGHGDLDLAARIDLGNEINSIQTRPLGPEGENFADGSAWRLLVRNYQGSWDQHVMENAGLVMLKPPTGHEHWFVFYSANHWADDSYSIGYADCGNGIHATGECDKVTTTSAWLASSDADKLYGPGTPTFYTDPAGNQLMSISAWKWQNGEHGDHADDNKRYGQIMKTYKITVNDNYVPHLELVGTDN